MQSKTCLGLKYMPIFYLLLVTRLTECPGQRPAICNSEANISRILNQVYLMLTEALPSPNKLSTFNDL